MAGCYDVLIDAIIDFLHPVLWWRKNKWDNPSEEEAQEWVRIIQLHEKKHAQAREDELRRAQR